MAMKAIEDTTLTNIADAIREKTQKTEPITPIQMPDEIKGISTQRTGFGSQLVYLNNSGPYTTTDSGWAGSIETVYTGIDVRENDPYHTSAHYVWLKKNKDADMWPIGKYNYLVEGHNYTVYLYVFTTGDNVIPWAQKRVYFNSYYSFYHNLGPITKDPQLIKFTFTYKKSASIYEPTLHIYPLHSQAPVYVTPILIVDEDEPKMEIPIAY